jgi:3D (Asp-Asp-Asp) domain-containing protein
MRTLKVVLALATCLTAVACAGGAEDDDPLDSSEAQLSKVRSFVAKGTGYFPANNKMEGGFLDRKGAKLRTLQQFLAGNAEYVSVAMDTNAFKYMQRLRIKELNDKYGKDIIFRVVDTGGAFKGKGTTRIDICTANATAAGDATINSKNGLHIDVIDDNAPAPSKEPTSPIPTPKPRPTPEVQPEDVQPEDVQPERDVVPELDTPPESGGATCGSDGACNPGNDGSGLICEASRCVPGCRSSVHCPGSKTCQSGQCR